MTKKQIKDKNMKNNRPIIPDDESAYSSHLRPIAE